MKRIVFIIITGALLGLQSCTVTTAGKVSTVKEQMENGAFLVDVRTPEEFEEGSVNGAVNIPLSEIESRIAEFQDKPSVIVFCRSGIRAGEAKQILEENGISNVTNGVNTENIEKELR